MTLASTPLAERARTDENRGQDFDPVVYDGAGHGFMRAGEAPDASDANRKARSDAWERWKHLLGQTQ